MVLTTKLVAGAVAAAGALLVFADPGDFASVRGAKPQAPPVTHRENRDTVDQAYAPPQQAEFACQSNCDLWRLFAPH